MALEDAYPVTRRLVGTDCFAALADAFVVVQPPVYGWLSAYGDGFPAFVRTHEVFASVPYLADVAQIEWARIHAANTPEEPGLKVAALTELAPEDLESIRLKLHPAATLVPSQFPVFAIWQAHHQTADDDALPSIDLNSGAQNVLVSRPGPIEVGVASLRAGDAALLSSLDAQSPFGAACQAAVIVEPDYDLGVRLSELIVLRALAAYPVENSTPVPR
jgi:hypothetical protein